MVLIIPSNFNARKSESHIGNRLPLAWQAFEMSLDAESSEDEREYQAAYLQFTPKMQLSGTWRGQCYIEAKNAEDYLARRHSRPAGIDLEQVAINRLRLWLPESDDFLQSTITVEQLGKELQRVSAIGTRVIREASDRTSQGFDFGLESSATAQLFKTAQIAWAGFVVDSITLFTKQREGDLTAVPFLEPKSITATPPPKVIYPLAVDFPGF